MRSCGPSLFVTGRHKASLLICTWYIVIDFHYSDVIMDAMAFQITSVSIVYSTVNSSADQRKHQSPASLAFVRGIHRRPANSPHKWPVARKRFPFDDIFMIIFQDRFQSKYPYVNDSTNKYWAVCVIQNHLKWYTTWPVLNYTKRKFKSSASDTSHMSPPIFQVIDPL